MTLTVRTALLLLAVVFFALGALGVQARINWDQAGKAAVVAAFLVP